jgi:hypothetical protein
MTLKGAPTMRIRAWWLTTLLFLAGCSGGGTSSSHGNGTTMTVAPAVVTADVDGSGTPSTLLIDTSKPSGSRVVQAIGVDASGAFVSKGSSPRAESIADAVTTARSQKSGTSSSDKTTLMVPMGSSATIPVVVQGL